MREVNLRESPDLNCCMGLRALLGGSSTRNLRAGRRHHGKTVCFLGSSRPMRPSTSSDLR